jgi:hypothetical protein
MSGKMNKMNKNMMEMLNMFVEYVNNQIGVDFETPLSDNEMSQDELLANFLKQDSIKKLIPKESSTKGKNKKEKDPAAPKRPKSSYIIFCGAKRDEIKKKNPEMKATEITKKLGEMWKALNDKQKKKYVDDANKDKERYEGEMNEYVPSEGFEKKNKKKSKAKRAPSGYIIFCGDKREEVKAENPEMKATEITKELGRLWKELSQEEKDEYNQRSKEISAELKSQSEDEEEKPKKAKKGKKKEVDEEPEEVEAVEEEAEEVEEAVEEEPEEVEEAVEEEPEEVEEESKKQTKSKKQPSKKDEEKPKRGRKAKVENEPEEVEEEQPKKQKSKKQPSKKEEEKSKRGRKAKVQKEEEEELLEDEE